MAASLKLAGVRALVDGALSAPTTIDLDGATIAAIGGDGDARREIRADGLRALPGIVDLHGDAFERQMMPRPGVYFREDLALLDTDRQLVANGVTTAYHGLTWSWEPGLRGTERAHAIADTLDRLRRGWPATRACICAGRPTISTRCPRCWTGWRAAAFICWPSTIIRRRCSSAARIRSRC